MIINETVLDFKIYPPEAQGVGQFDGGRITEIKPIAFPHEGLAPKNLGPLFYWAWASAKGYGKIALHPHQGFEIISYVLQGEIGHYDSLENRSRVRAGGAQVIQAASGISHQEETVAESNEFFQIWFEPDLRETLQHDPTYNEYQEEDFPSEYRDGITIKTLIGKGAPIHLESEIKMQDVLIEKDRQLQIALSQGKTLALMTVSGQGILSDMTNKHPINKRDFALVHAEHNGDLSIQAASLLRVVMIEVPAQVDYPLYRNP